MPSTHRVLNLGLVCPDFSGHLNPMTTLGRELMKRGHRVTLVGRLDSRRKVEAAGLNYAAIGEKEFPLGSVAASSADLGRLRGLRALRFTADMLLSGTRLILRELPGVAQREGFEGMLVDQVAPAGSTVGDQLGLPYVVICNALPMNPDPNLPPGVTAWPYSAGGWGVVRNQLGNSLLRALGQPIRRAIQPFRAKHGLPRLPGDIFSGFELAQISQVPAFFDFPRKALPDHFHYSGPWHDVGNADPVPFPWERLDGRPLIYASMGTLQNRVAETFGIIAEACAGLDAQLVISLGSRDQDAGKMAAGFAGSPLVVPFAPQLDLLQRASLVITHAGLNTALETLSHGLPMVAIPVTNDQPGVANRLAWLGAAEVVQSRKLTAPRLRLALDKVLQNPSYRENARQRQRSLAQINGVAHAADIVEQAVTSRERVRKVSQ